MAIAYFTMQCVTVCVPLNDNQSYDLVVELGGELKRIQVKTTGFKRGNNYCVALKATRHNRTTIKTNLFDPGSCDYVFVFTESGEKYLIPSKDIEAKHEIALYGRYDEYKL